MISVQIHDTLEKVQPIVSEWENLANSTQTPEIGLFPYWILTWWKLFGETGSRHLLILSFWQGNELVGIAPMQKYTVEADSVSRWLDLPMVNRAVRISRIALLCSGEAINEEVCTEYLNIVVKPGMEADVANSLLDHLTLMGDWDEILFPTLKEGAINTAHIKEAACQRYDRVKLSNEGTSHYINLPDSFDIFLSERSRNQRYRFKRHLSRFNTYSKNNYQLHFAKNTKELDLARSLLESLHTSRWNSAGKSGAFTSKRFQHFHQQIMPLLLANEQLDLSWLTVNEKPVSAMYCFKIGKRLQFYQAGRDPDFPNEIPIGTVHHLLRIQQAISEGFEEYDFLAGTRRYKLELSNDQRNLQSLSIINPNLRARLYNKISSAIAERRKQSGS